tara:strand:- start:39240 stop:43250 length:4011 start_codon:yes stop_codon:yes gene_type:complete
MKNPPQIKNKVQFNPFSGPQIESVIHTTKAQSEILIDCLFGGDDAKRAYNLSFSLNFLGDFKFNALKRAIEHLVERHESLRASFSEDGAFMCIFSEIAFEISYNDLSNKLEDEKLKLKDELQHQDINYLFDLVHDPLFKASVIKLSENAHIFIITVHHSICDGLSIDVFLEELGVIYSAYVQDKLPNLPEVDPYSLFAEKENLFAESNEYKLSEDFWLNMYQESVPKVELPIDYPRPQLRTYNNHRLDFLIDKNLLNALKHTGLNAGCSLVTTLMTAFEVFLYQQTGQNDLVVGLTNSRPAHFDMTQIIGHGVNVLPLRSKVDLKITFNEYLTRRKTQFFDAYEHQSISFGHILEKLSVARDPSRIPLVPVTLNLELNKNLENEISFHNLSHDLTLNIGDYGTFEIELQAFKSKDGPCFRWKYNTTLFKPDTIKQMMASFEALLEKLVYNPTESISEIITSNFLSAYNKLNDTKVDYPTETLYTLLKKQAEIYTSNLALEFQDTKLSYEALYKKANKLAHYFTNQGINPGDYVGVAINRSPELLATLIAILECGAAYVPLDPNYPKSRLEFILKDSNAKHVITNNDSAFEFDNTVKQIYIEDALNNLTNLSYHHLEVTLNQDSVAYILYTSGTTGKPKGVPITNKNLVNLLFSIARESGITEQDRFLAITTISFDIAGVELFLPLLNGASIVMADSETARNGELLLKLIETKQISIVQATPTTWKMLLESNWKQPLKIKAFCGGEALTYDLAQRILSKCDKLWNMYGPTETTIYSIIKEIKSDDTLITIGKPIANTQLYILNSNGQLAPPGVIGEIVIAGDGIGLGYLNRPDLSSEKFIKNPFYPDSNSIIYRTGDLGKLLPTNEILCLGRLDQQIKVRGYRIEPEEIEKTLVKINDICEAVVLAHNDSLIAFVKPLEYKKITNEQISAWKTYLADELPSYFVPNQIKIIKELPTTPNGKLDRQALLNYEYIQIDSSDFTKPQNDSEKLVAEIWKKYLHSDSIDIRSNFFELGGNSLIAIQVMNQLEKEIGERLPLSSLFEYSTIKEFSLLLNKKDKTETWSSLVPIKPKGNKTPIYIVHGAGMEVLIFKELADNLDVDQPVFGLQAKELFNTGERYDSIEKIASHYVETIINHNPEGPYAIAGYSLGGILAFEMARKFLKLGKKVTMVGLFDTVIEPHFYHNTPLRKKLALRAYRYKRRFYFLKEMTKSWKNFKFHINQKKKFMLTKNLETKNFNTDQDLLKHQEFLKTESIIQPIKSRYYITPLEIEVDLFRAEEKIGYVDDSIFMRWKKFALKGLNIHKIPGNHDTILSSQHIKEVASVFQNILDLRNHANKN